jgi:hypothetical protein
MHRHNFAHRHPPKLGPTTDDEGSGSDSNGNESQDDAPVQRGVVRSPVRNVPIMIPALRDAVKSLDYGLLQTRFLTIIPGSSAQVSCKLTVRSLIDKVEYVALSYSWGDQTSTRRILLDGRVTEVTTSLEAALQELRRRRILVVWVDALCINQANGYEKVYQLRQMGTIFSKATKVVAWLGPDANSSSSYADWGAIQPSDHILTWKAILGARLDCSGTCKSI